MTKRIWPLNLLEKVARSKELVEVILKDGFSVRGRLVYMSRGWGCMILDGSVWVDGHYVLLVRLPNRTYVGKE